MLDLHKLQDCFGKLKQGHNGLVGSYYNECLKQQEGIGDVKVGVVLPDGKPQHDLYDMNPEAENKINDLLQACNQRKSRSEEY